MLNGQFYIYSLISPKLGQDFFHTYDKLFENPSYWVLYCLKWYLLKVHTLEGNSLD